MTAPRQKNPCTGGREIYYLGRLFFGHHYYTLTLSDLRLNEKKKILLEIMHVHYMTYLVTPSTRIPALGIIKFSNFGGPFLDIPLVYLICAMG